jgi:hypothetical protein
MSPYSNSPMTLGDAASARDAADRVMPRLPASSRARPGRPRGAEMWGRVLGLLPRIEPA